MDRMLQGRIRGILGYGWFVAEDLGDDGGNGVVGEDVRIVERRGQRQGDVVSIGAAVGCVIDVGFEVVFQDGCEGPVAGLHEWLGKMSAQDAEAAVANFGRFFFYVDRHRMCS